MDIDPAGVDLGGSRTSRNLRDFILCRAGVTHGTEVAASLSMNVHVLRRRCVLCSSPILGIPKPASPDVCFICGLSAEEEARIESENASAPRTERLPVLSNRATLRSV